MDFIKERDKYIPPPVGVESRIGLSSQESSSILLNLFNFEQEEMPAQKIVGIYSV